jgi:hypothetical protein
MALSGELFTRGDDGRPQRDTAFLVVLNRADEPVAITLPSEGAYGRHYRRLLDTDDDRPSTAPPTAPGGTTVTVARRSVTLLRVEERSDA